MPRQGLTPALVVARAAELADEVGYDGLTLAALAARLDVAVPSLYKHVAGLDAVRQGVSVLAVRELGDALAAAAAPFPPVDAGARLEAVAMAFRAYATGHPGRYAATVRAGPAGDSEHRAASEAALAPVLSVLADLGLQGEAAIDAARAMRAAVHGFVSLEAAGGFGLSRDVDRSFARLVEWLERAFRESSV